jgi:RimJ/RimL family protein N-acetyltransferase
MKKTTRPILPTPTQPIKTARLLLRPFKPSDLPDLHVLRSQIEVMKWTSQGHIDVDKEATQTWMNRFLPPNDSTLFNFVVEELSNPGVAIGGIGCHHAEPPECGYMLRTEYWGKGYATEGFRGWLQAWWDLPRKEVVIEESKALSENPVEPIFVHEVLLADVEEQNVASARILANCGFRRISEQVIETNGKSVKLVTLELPRPAAS